jgi:uncharacterized protein YicC (UPF0701 family)
LRTAPLTITRWPSNFSGEANTLGAKSVLAETSQRAVDLKVVIEQIREQVQNLQ